MFLETILHKSQHQDKVPPDRREYPTQLDLATALDGKVIPIVNVL